MPKKSIPTEDILIIRNLAREGLTEREIADRLSIDNIHRVRNIVTGYSYKKIPPPSLTKEQWKQCREKRKINATITVGKEMSVRK